VTVDSTNEVGAYNAIAYGSDDLPVIAYYDNTFGNLKIIKCSLPDCSDTSPTGNKITLVDETNDVGRSASIAVPADGLPVVSYWDLTNSLLKVLKCSLADCSDNSPSGNLITAIDTGGSNDIALGNDDLPVIVYNDGAAEELMFVKCTDPTCSSPIPTPILLDTSKDSGGSPRIAMTTDGRPMIVYIEGIKMFYLVCNDDSCSNGTSIPRVDIAGGGPVIVFWPVVALSTDEKPVIAYWRLPNGTNTMQVVRCADLNCSVIDSDQLVDNTFLRVPNRYDMTVPADNFPILVYDEFNLGGQLTVRKCHDPQCLSSLAERFSTVTGVWFTSIAISPDGFPIISSSDSTSGFDLKVTKCYDPKCDPTVQLCTVEGGPTMIASGNLNIGATALTKTHLKAMLCKGLGLYC